MRLIFAGTPPIAAVVLRALRDAGHEVLLVLTQPPRPAGRGLKLRPTAVALEAMSLQLPVREYSTLRSPQVQDELRDLKPDAMIVVAYGLLLPPEILRIPSHGCLNIHASLLPRWRGAAPIQRAIEAGDSETGISIMQMDAGLDTGPVLLKARLPIEKSETSGSLLERLTAVAAATIVEALANLRQLSPLPQEPEGATYARKIEKAEVRIDWSLPASVLSRRIRAFNPSPGCEGVLAGEKLKIWNASPIQAGPARATPIGSVITTNTSITVQCGGGSWLEIHELQASGGKRLSAKEYLRGNPIAAGAQFA